MKSKKWTLSGKWALSFVRSFVRSLFSVRGPSIGFGFWPTFFVPSSSLRSLRSLRRRFVRFVRFVVASSLRSLRSLRWLRSLRSLRSSCVVALIFVVVPCRVVSCRAVSCRDGGGGGGGGLWVVDEYSDGTDHFCVRCRRSPSSIGVHSP